MLSGFHFLWGKDDATENRDHFSSLCEQGLFHSQRHLISEISSYRVDPAAEVRLGGIATLPIQAYRDLVD